MTTVQPYTDQGNFTQFHNANFDVIMPMVSGSAWKILCLIIRKTKGWQKDEDDIAYSQLKAGTGIKSDATIKKSIDELLSLGVIQVGKPKHQANPNAYRLNKSFSCRTSKNEDSTPKKWSTNTSKNEDTKESKEIINKAHTHELLPDDVQTLIPSLAKVSKTPYWVKTESEYNEAAYVLKEYNASTSKVDGFLSWWKDNGYYDGKPALTTIISEWENYTSTKQAFGVTAR